jgi:long-chain acyl-CoA synthetase
MAEEVMAESGSVRAQVRGAQSVAPPVPALDGLLAAAAQAFPSRVAVRSGSVALTFAALDAAVTRCAAALARLTGGQRCVVAVASLLDPEFAIAYYGAVRSGSIVSPLNPLLREAELEHVLGVAQARVAVLTPAVYRRIRAIRHRLPCLQEVLLMGPGSRGDDPDEQADARGCRPLGDLLAAAGAASPAHSPRDPGDAACIQFTSGTTALPKGVVLTHANLCVNAVQTARAHGLSADSVCLNHLPTYHPMHLNSAVFAGATQVLCADADPVAAVAAANTYRASHYYSLPVRLARLAADPRLAGTRLETVTAIASGGSALPATAAQTLSHHFRVPVFQGYGLAETSPLLHSASPDDPCPGSVGPPVAGTETRIADVGTGAVAAPGDRGEVQVRGPQVMRRYLGDILPPLDADGWLSTGDVGYLDESGRLYLVDRLKDVFKCDNWLVSPSEIEYVLARHPKVAECAVVDRPDHFSGAVAYAFVVPVAGAGQDRAEPAEDLKAEIQAAVNRQVPYYKQIRQLSLVAEIPRSPNGKVERKRLRAEAARLAE